MTILTLSRAKEIKCQKLVWSRRLLLEYLNSMLELKVHNLQRRVMFQEQHILEQSPIKIGAQAQYSSHPTHKCKKTTNLIQFKKVSILITVMSITISSSQIFKCILNRQQIIKLRIRQRGIPAMSKETSRWFLLCLIS